MHCEGKLILRSHNTSYCLIEVVTKACFTVQCQWLKAYKNIFIVSFDLLGMDIRVANPQLDIGGRILKVPTEATLVAEQFLTRLIGIKIRQIYV